MNLTRFILFFISFLAFSCGQENDSNEKLKLQKEKVILEKEKQKLEEKLNRQNQLEQVIEQSQMPPTVEYIKSSLLERSIVFKPKNSLKKQNWTFAALSEFKNISIAKSEMAENYWEALLDLDLEDYKSGKEYYMRLFVSYTFIDENWVIQKYDAINYFEK